MKLHATDHSVTRSGELVETNFTVRTTAKTFAILSSGLYSDKIAAPIRELCCNAYDAHVAAGNTDTPFEVTLPSSLTPTFSVRDYGTGMSDEDVRNLYTTYFDSTKTSSDDMIGALGLGSKSPFAYTSSFSIESRYNGQKRMYAAFINESGVPALAALMDAVDTDEPNGMTISFPVKSADIGKFADRAKRILMYFPVPPLVSGYYGFSPYALSHTVEGSNWKIRTTQYDAHMTGAYVIQGCVAYPLDVSIIDGLSEVALAVAGTSLDMFVPIGDVEVAPSREALSYDPITCANLIKHLENAAVEMRDSIQETIDKCDTMWAARRTINKMFSDDKMSAVFKPLHTATPFTFKSLPINTTITVTLDGVTTAAVEMWVQNTRYRRGGGRKVYQDIDRIEPLTDDNDVNGVRNSETVIQQQHTVIMVDDVYKGYKAIVTAYAAQQYNRTNKCQHYVVIRPLNPKVPVSNEDYALIAAQLGNPEVVAVSALDVPAAARKVSTYRPRAKGTGLVFIGFDNGSTVRTGKKFSRLTWRQEAVDFELGGFYMPLHRFDIVQPNVDVYNIQYILDGAQSIGLMSEDELSRVYGFSEKDLESVAGDANWVNLFDHLRPLIVAAINTPQLLADAALDAFISDTYTVERFAQRWTHIKHRVKDGAFKEFWESIATPPVFSRYDHNQLRTLASTFREATNDSKVVVMEQAHLRRFEALRETYGMLKLIHLDKVDDTTQWLLVDYINGVEDATAYAEEHKAA